MGAWARACDGRDVSGGDHAERAVAGIGQAMVWADPALRVKRVELAGAHLRAWRRTLPHQAGRRDDEDDITDRLLWVALRDTGRAQGLADLAPAAAAGNIRWAEAALRTWWKEQR